MENKTFKISIRIILLFTMAIALSFIPDYLHTFFGDWYCGGRYGTWSVYSGCDYTAGAGFYSAHNPTWHWGYRHWLWLFMGISLAITQIVNIISKI